MRVIAGQAKGNSLKAPKGMHTRPTTDRVRESLFAILGERIVDKSFLDLFAGSGANGIEALSRGASRCVFIDKDPRSSRIIKENLAMTKLTQFAQVYTCDITQAIKIMGKKGETYDNIFLDPPYGTPLGQKAIDSLAFWQICSPTGLIILENAKGKIATNPAFRLWRKEDYGSTTLSFFLRQEGE